MVDPSKKVPDLKCEVPDLLLEVVGLKQEVPDLRSGGIPLNLTPGYAYAILAVGLCLSVSVCLSVRPYVRHKSEFYLNG